MVDHVDNLCVGLYGNVNATLTVLGNISGQVSSPSKTLYQVGIPDLYYPKYVAAGSRLLTMESSLRLKAEFLILVPNLRY